MRRDQMADLTALVVVAEERSFTRAASKLGMSQSALSQVVRRLEERLGMRLLTRTTRSVAPTEAGEALVSALGPMLSDLDARIAELAERRGRPVGTIRITSVEHAAKTILVPRLAPLLREHPDIKVEISVNYGLVDVVAERFDAGVRLGSQIAKDMVAVRIGADMLMAIVGAPGYFRSRPSPAEPGDLLSHRCINLRLPSSGSDFAWPLAKGGRPLQVHPEGAISTNSIEVIRQAALDGLGLAYLPLDQVQADLDAGRLSSVLAEFVPPLPGYHLYYPARRGSSAFKLVVEALRMRT